MTGPPTAPRPPARGRLDSLPAPLRGIGGLLALLALAGLIAWGALTLTGALDSADVDSGEVIQAGGSSGDPEQDPFAWDNDRGTDFEAGATLGFSHVIYELSPGGVMASARRTASFDDEIKAAAKEHDVDPDVMEAIVLLESAGRPDVIAGGTDVSAAAGLAQIVASTGTDFLDMSIYLDRSQQLTDELNSSLQKAEKLSKKAAKLGSGNSKQRKKAKQLAKRAEQAGKDAERAQRARVQVDDRFDPALATKGMALYLEKARRTLGRDDLAIASYHMGIGNLQDVLAAYTGDGAAAAEGDISYAQLYFDTSPLDHPEAYKVLSGFEDDSSTYYWRVLAAEEIMRLYHDDRDKLSELIRLHSNKATAEEVFHPEDETRTFDDATELQDGLDSGELVEIPTGPDYGYRIGSQLGELTGRLGVDRKLYESLRPEALAALIYMTSRVEAITGKHGRKDKLIVTSAVRDQAYQDALVGSNPEATPEYSLHTTGYAFDILRKYRNDKQARAFQFVLDRLSALGVIDYAREPQAIHVTVSNLAKPLLDD